MELRRQYIDKEGEDKKVKSIESPAQKTGRNSVPAVAACHDVLGREFRIWHAGAKAYLNLS